MCATWRGYTVPSEYEEALEAVHVALIGLELTARSQSAFIGYDIDNSRNMRVFCQLWLGRGRHPNFFGIIPQIGHLLGITGRPRRPLLTNEESSSFRTRINPYVVPENFMRQAGDPNPYFPKIHIQSLMDEDKRRACFDILSEMASISHQRLSEG